MHGDAGGDALSMVTTLPRTLIIARHLLHQYGFSRPLARPARFIDLRCWRWKTAAVWRRKSVRALYQALKEDGWLG